METERSNKAVDVREKDERIHTGGVLSSYVTRGRRRVQRRGWEKTDKHGGGVRARTAELNTR